MAATRRMAGSRGARAYISAAEQGMAWRAPLRGSKAPLRSRHLKRRGHRAPARTAPRADRPALCSNLC